MISGLEVAQKPTRTDVHSYGLCLKAVTRLLALTDWALIDQSEILGELKLNDCKAELLNAYSKQYWEFERRSSRNFDWRLRLLWMNSSSWQRSWPNLNYNSITRFNVRKIIVGPAGWKCSVKEENCD